MPRNQIEETIARLRELARDPGAGHREELEAALHCKWEGVQVVAGRILASWACPESERAVREWFLRLSSSGSSKFAVAEVAARCLSRFLSPECGPWVLPRFFADSVKKSGRWAFWYLPLLERTEYEFLTKSLVDEAKRLDWSTQEAVVEAAIALCEDRECATILELVWPRLKPPLLGRVRAIRRWLGEKQQGA